MSKEIKNKFEIGDRVEDNNTKCLGIVIDTAFIQNEGGIEPISKVHLTNCDLSLIGMQKDCWICDGNLTISKTRVITNPSSPA